MGDVFERVTWDLNFPGRSEWTRRVYLVDIRSFAAFHGGCLEGLGQAGVREWVKHLLAAGTLASRLRQHLSALVWLFRKTLGRPVAV